MINRETALQYAEKLGWHIFPIYEMVNGVCSCGQNCHSPGKHPRVAHGLKEATKNRHTITKWWTDWPNANIGVATGHESGIVVIDQDGFEGEMSLQDCMLPTTVTSITGGGGKHYIYKHDGNYIKSTTGVLPSVDSRADGGYIVVAPSNHASGNVYRWQNDPFEYEIAECPTWWLEALNNVKVTQNKYLAKDSTGEVKLKQGSRNSTIASLAGTLRRAGLGFDAIYNACIHVPCEDGTEPLDNKEIETIVRSICNYEAGDPAINNAEKFIKEVLERNLKHRINNLAKVPEPEQIKDVQVMPQRGLAHDMVDFILSQSELPQPEIATAVVMTFLGTVIGRKVQSPSGLLTNNAFVCLSDSGTGKDKAMSLIKRLAENCGLMKLIGPGEIASGVAVRSLLREIPSVLLPMDEFGIKLKSITGQKSASHESDIIPTIMQAYSRAQDVDTGKAYADRRLKAPEPIYRPCLGFVGTTTAKPFYEAIGSGEGENGFIARFLTFDIKKYPTPKKVTHLQWPERIVNAVKNLAKGQRDMVEFLDGSINPDIPMIPYDEGLDDVIHNFRYETLPKYMTSEASKSIYARVTENAIKLALTESYSSGNKTIDYDSWIWARDICLFSAHTACAMLTEHVADTKTEAWGKKIVAWIKEGKSEGRTNRDLTRRFQGIEKWQRQQIIEDLIEGGTLLKKEIKNEHGPSTNIFIHANYVH